MPDFMISDTADELAAGLLRDAMPVAGTDRLLVPEPAAKAALRMWGLSVPRHVTVPDGPQAASAAVKESAALTGPIVLKAWGSGIVHKSELAAVRLDLSAATLGPAVEQMRAALTKQGFAPEGYLLEEQALAGVEVLVGVVDKPPFGAMAVLGVGGTLVELVNDVVSRLCPLSLHDAEQMVDGFAGAALLKGYRSAQSANRAALIELLLAVAGTGGLVDELGPALAEFECNPVIVEEHSATVADARLILHADPPQVKPCRRSNLDRLFAPRSVAIAGASASRTTVANRALRRYRDWGWHTGLYAVHPESDEIEGVPAYPTAGAIPGGVDYLILMLPPAHCAGAVRSLGGRGAFVHVLSSGFSESADQESDESDLLCAVRETAVRLVGPNSLGVYAPGGSQTFAPGLPREPGHLGGVFQSGGLAQDVVYLVGQHGVRFSKAVSSGNAADIGLGELAEYLVDDYETEILAVHVEGGADAQLIDTLRRSRGRKPAVLLATGLSVAGSRMAASHTGALTSDRQCWDAVSASTGTVVVETVEDFVAVLHHIGCHIDTPAWVDDSVLVIGPGGGASVMAADACDANGLRLAECSPAAVAALSELGFGVGTSLHNPVDVPVFQGTGPEMMTEVVDAVLGAQRFSDVLLHVDIATYYALGAYSNEFPGVTHLVAALRALGDVVSKGARISLVARNIDAATGDDLEMIRTASVAARVPLHRTFAEAALAIHAGQRLLSLNERGGL